MTIKGNRVDFLPSRDGFHFENSFVNVILPKGLKDSFIEAVVGGFLGFLLGPFEGIGAAIGAILGGTTDISAGSGRCGGMCWLALDYWYAKKPVPTAMGSSGLNRSSTDDFKAIPNDVPADNTPLSTNCYNRQMDSLLTTSMWAQTGVWCINESDLDVGQKTTRNEFPRVMQSIDQGNPLVLSMITRNNDMGGLHQVVAFGYSLSDDGFMTVNIYDPNFPDNDTIILSALPNAAWDETDTSPDLGINQTDSIKDNHHTPWKGWFVEEYARKPAPVTDIVVNNDLAIARPVKLGTPFACECEVKNSDTFYPAHAQGIRLVAKNFGTVWIVQEGDATSIAQLRSMEPASIHSFRFEMPSLNIPATVPHINPYGSSGNASLLPQITGPVTFFVQYQSVQGYWITIPAAEDHTVANTAAIPIEPAAFIDGPDVQSWTAEIDPTGNPIAKLVCAATPYYFDGVTHITWTVDGANAGEGERLALPPIALGRGAQFKPSHAIVVMVRSEGPPAQDLSQGITFTIPNLSAELQFNPLFSQVAVKQKVTAVLAVTDAGYNVIAIDAKVFYAIGKFSLQWEPRPASLLNSGATAVYNITPDGDGHSLTDFSGKAIDVSLNVTDEAGRSCLIQKTFSAVQATVAPSPLTTEPGASQIGPRLPSGGDPGPAVDSRTLGSRVLTALDSKGATVERMGAKTTYQRILPVNPAIAEKIGTA